MTCQHQIVHLSPAEPNGVCADCGVRIRIDHDDEMCAQLLRMSWGDGRINAECDREFCPCVRKLMVPDAPWEELHAKSDQLLAVAASLRAATWARHAPQASRLAIELIALGLVAYRGIDGQRDREWQEIVAQLRGFGSVEPGMGSKSQTDEARGKVEGALSGPRKPLGP